LAKHYRKYFLDIVLYIRELTGGEAKRHEGELPQELPETEPAYVGTGTGQAKRQKPRGEKKWD